MGGLGVLPQENLEIWSALGAILGLLLPWMAKESPLPWARWSGGDQRAQGKGLSFAIQGKAYLGLVVKYIFPDKFMIFS